MMESTMLDTTNAAPAPLVSIEGLRVEFKIDGSTVVGVEDVSFAILPGETVCVVGESGSGKSVTSLSLMRLVEFGGGSITGAACASPAPTGRSPTSPRPAPQQCGRSAATRSA